MPATLRADRIRPRKAPLLALATAAALGAAAAPGNANAQGPRVLSGDQVVAGRTVTAWSAPMATWLVERAKPTDCNAGQRGRMFFLYSAGGGHAKVDCTVAAGTPLMILPAGIICWDKDVPMCLSPKRRREVVQVGVKIDGLPLKVRRRDWTSKSGFKIRGAPGSTAGYYYVLDGLAPGPHTIVLFDRVEPPGAGVSRARTTISLTVR